MNMNKRGTRVCTQKDRFNLVSCKRSISDVIATVLIILVVLAAVILVWNFVKSMVSEKSGDIGSDIFSVSLNAKLLSNNPESLTLSVGRDAGGGNISEVRIISKNASSSCTYNNNTDVPGELESVSYNINLSSCSDPTNLEIYPILIVNGKEKIGMKTELKVSATELVNAVHITCYGDYDGDGYGNGTSIVSDGTSCPEHYTETNLGLDCNDNDAGIHPGADIPNNGVDDNCDGYDSINMCQSLAISNVNYLLANDIINTGSMECLRISSVGNVTLDLGGHTLSGVGTTNSRAVSIIGANNITVKNGIISGFYHGMVLTTFGGYNTLLNLVLNSNLYDGILINSNSNNNILTNINASSDGVFGIALEGSNNNTLTNITASFNNIGIYVYSGSSGNNITNITANGNQVGLKIESSRYNYINSMIANGGIYGAYLPYNSNNNTLAGITARSNTYGIYMLGNSSNNLIKDSNVVTNNNDIEVLANCINDIFLNTTSGYEFVETGGQLIRAWHYSAHVSSGPGANVIAYNRSGSSQFSLTTGNDGNTPQTAIIDYVNNGGTRSYYSNYTINASKTGTTISHSLNITLLRNYDDVFPL
jgi:parallel beta-helix repeat protein